MVQTLQPVPVQPVEQEQPAAVKFEDPPDAGTKERLEPSNMVPPQAGCEQFEPPNPGGQRQLDEEDVEPKFAHDWAAALVNRSAKVKVRRVLDSNEANAVDIIAACVCSRKPTRLWWLEERQDLSSPPTLGTGLLIRIHQAISKTHLLKSSMTWCLGGRSLQSLVARKKLSHPCQTWPEGVTPIRG